MPSSFLTGPRLSRRGFAGASAAFLSAPFLLGSTRFEDGTVVTETTLGKVRGTRRDGVDVYRGIPYVGDVSGSRRFLPPQKMAPWAGVRDALALAAPSIQPPGGTHGIDEPAPDENCLFLNVWLPARERRNLPVMFYSHGGAFVSGSAGSITQDGSNLARDYDVIVVATNHRLGLLGYLYLGELGGDAYAHSGNQGLWDIKMGLSWVRENIAAFGGDPDNVMIFGESGGGAKTSCLYAMPSAAPLFAKAAIQSGPAVLVGERNTAAKTTRIVLDELGLAANDWRKLIDVPAETLLKAQQGLATKYKPDFGSFGRRGIARLEPGGYGPILDPDLLPHHPFSPDAPPCSRDKPLITGWIDSEASFFSWLLGDRAAFSLNDGDLRSRLTQELGDAADNLLAAYRLDRPGASPSDLYLAIESERIMGLGTLAIAERKAAQGRSPVFYYNLAYRSNMILPGIGVEAGALHAIDIPLVFNNPSSPASLLGNRPDRVPAARHMSEMWASFARTGVPSAEGQPAWKPYDAAHRNVMVIDSQCALVEDRHAAERKAWTTISA